MRVALTFDTEHPDRPGSTGRTEERMVELLAAMDVRATFFMQGRWVEAYPETASRIARAGHLVGSHSFYHAPMPLLSESGLRADLAAAQRVISLLVGVESRPWFRCPFGLGWDDARVTEALTRCGYRHVGWDVVGYDWEPERSPEAIGAHVVDQVLARASDAVVLLHAWPEQTLEALPDLIGRLRVCGAEFVGVDELDRVPVAAEV